MFSIHATKKILDRIGQSPAPPVERPDTALGNWCAHALFWRPQVALLVSERTLFPVVMPLAPAATLLTRFPTALAEVLRAGGVDRAFIAAEVVAMAEGRFARTARARLPTPEVLTPQSIPKLVNGPPPIPHSPWIWIGPSRKVRTVG